MNMSLYHSTSNYYLVIEHGTSFNYVIDFRNYTTKMIGNDDLATFEKLELTYDNLKKVLKDINKQSFVNIDDFNDSYTYNQVIYYKDKPFYVNNWRDVLNIISG